MQYSQNIKLNDFFSKLTEENYVIIKLSDNFPNYFNGDDLDIFCEDINSFSQKILTTGNEYIKKNNCKINVRQESPTHYYIDFIFDKKLDIRFDLYGKLPNYKNLKLKNNLFGTILRNKTKKQKTNCSIYVPSPNEEMILRYVEFLEWFNKRPDKIKHLDFILDNTSNPITKEKFLMELHNYVKFYKEVKKGKNYINQKLLFKKIKNTLKEILIKIPNIFVQTKRLPRNFAEMLLGIIFKSKRNELHKIGIKKFILKMLKYNYNQITRKFRKLNT